MNVCVKKTDKGEIAILPRKEYEALATKAAEADEDIGSARLVARARKKIRAEHLISNKIKLQTDCRLISSTGILTPPQCF
jgi:hypothetical protein